MRFSQVNILVGMTAAGIVAVGSVPLHAMTSQLACSLRPWVTIIPLNFMFGLLFGKTMRIYRIMNNKQLKALKIKESWVVFVAFLLTVPEILIHGTYFIVSAPKVQRKACMFVVGVACGLPYDASLTHTHTHTTHTVGAQLRPQRVHLHLRMRWQVRLPHTDPLAEPITH